MSGALALFLRGGPALIDTWDSSRATVGSFAANPVNPQMKITYSLSGRLEIENTNGTNSPSYPDYALATIAAGTAALYRWRVRSDTGLATQDSGNGPVSLINGILDVWLSPSDTNGALFNTDIGTSISSWLGTIEISFAADTSVVLYSKPFTLLMSRTSF